MSTTLNAPTYQSVKRKRNGLDMALGFPGAQHVPLAAEGADQFQGVAFVNLPAKTLDVNLNQVGKRIKSFVPNMFRDLGSAHRPINVACEVVEQGKFLSGKLDSVVRSPNAAGPSVEHKVCNMNRLPPHLGATPQQCTHSGEELVKVKGLAQIVVGPGVESLHPVVDSVTRGKHQDGYSRTARSQVFADLDSVFPGQHHIQQDEVVIVNTGLVERGLSIGRNVDSVGLLAKAFRQDLGCIGLVLDQQYPHESLRSRAVARINANNVSRRHLNEK